MKLRCVLFFISVILCDTLKIGLASIQIRMFQLFILLTGSLPLLLTVVTVFIVSFLGSSGMASSLDSSICQLKRSTDKLARYQSHFCFINKCLKFKCLPKGMNIKFGKSALPPNSFLVHRVDEILQTAGHEIAAACKDTYAILIDEEKGRIQQMLYDIQQNYDFYQFEAARQLQHSLYKHLFRKLSTKKKKKFSLLQQDEPLQEDITLPGKKKRIRRFKRREYTNTFSDQNALENCPRSASTVVNLSNVSLTESQERLLNLNYHFCPVPRSIDKHGLKADIIEGTRKVRLREWILHKKKENNDSSDIDLNPPRFYKKTFWSPPTGRDSSLDAFCDSMQALTDNFDFESIKVRDNLSVAERKALQELKSMVKHRIVRISRADKGGAVVLQDVDKYVKEGHRLLCNPAHYDKVSTDPTPHITTASNKIIDRLKMQGNIDEMTYKWARLDHNNVRPHVFYHIPKIHKTLVDPPGRPIVSGVGGPTETLSKLVDYWLRPLVTKLPSYIKDSTHFLGIIQDWNTRLGPFDDSFMFVTIDVVNLYGSIPHQDMEQAICHFLDCVENTDAPPVHTIIEIVRHVLQSNYFTFEGAVYHQKSGTAMGTPMAPTVANLFMGWLEGNILKGSPVKLMDDTWKRFIDDIFLLWKGSQAELDNFVTYLNSFHGSISFTVNSSRSRIPFLDILLSFENGYISTELYSKDTDVHGYVPFRSCHPRHTINNIPGGQFLRLRRLCSTLDKFYYHSSKMATFFHQRGYPDTLIRKAIDRAASTPRDNTLMYQPKRSNRRVPFVVTHNPRNPPLRQWLSSKMAVLHNSANMKVAVPDTPIVGERKCMSLGNLLMPSRLPSPQVPIEDAGCFPCPMGCITCREHLVLGNTFSSSHTGETFTSRQKFTCESKNIIYLLFCNICNDSQYVGETSCELKTRFYQHRSNIKQNSGSLVARHFNQRGHSLNNLRCFVIEEVYGRSHYNRQIREDYWMAKLHTVSPLGLNVSLNFQ